MPILITQRAMRLRRVKKEGREGVRDGLLSVLVNAIGT